MIQVQVHIYSMSQLLIHNKGEQENEMRQGDVFNLGVGFYLMNVFPLNVLQIVFTV